MITILYPYRNRELERVKRSLDSLAQQTNRDFKVVFVDYGSALATALEIETVLKEYDFVNYIYSYHCHQPWSRAKAINIGLRQVVTPYVFVADVDMLFRNDFVETITVLRNPKHAVFFKVGFLDQKESVQFKFFEAYKISFVSQVGAKGLSLFPIDALNEIVGFDEFFHFWGAEDEDVHGRLEQAGYESIFYEHEVLMLHQWHESYRASERKTLTTDLQLTQISRLNQQHLLQNKERNADGIAAAFWGKTITKEEYEIIANHSVVIVIGNQKDKVDHFLYAELPCAKSKIINVVFQKDPFQSSWKYWVKKRLGKTVPNYYPLKTINDLVLLHLTSFYRNNNYSYIISEDLKTIQLKIRFN
ncbi:glycosyltransferase family 2 protein [Flavobacterium sp. Arc2]|uniref:glycosyltransferase family 2 protein n=1 Tax=Flavobacterium sp. Arc2 TaxID=3046685 RepID=UPI00352F6158